MAAQFRNLAKVYAEFPPVWHGKNSLPIPPHLLEQISCPPLFPRDQITATYPEGMIDYEAESKRYRFIAYIELAPSVVA